MCFFNTFNCEFVYNFDNELEKTVFRCLFSVIFVVRLLDDNSVFNRLINLCCEYCQGCFELMSVLTDTHCVVKESVKITVQTRLITQLLTKNQKQCIETLK